jgi:AraC family transcriptional regulator, regulatory protein of adaptative response / methylated-DNA-[protein]-cysteine methyltransferase
MKQVNLNAITNCADTLTEDIRLGFGEFALCAVLVAVSDKRVVANLMGDIHDGLRRELADTFPHARLTVDEAGPAEMVAQVVAFLNAPYKGLDLPLDMRGSLMERTVWRALRDVPAGQRVTYG